jgi:peptidyl-prolyl cis-trans isomerase C
MESTTSVTEGTARVNNVALHAANETLGADELRQRACTELLRQAAIAKGLLPNTDKPCDDGVLSELASSAIEALLDQSLSIPEPQEDACRRYYAANKAHYATGERVNVRHILFAVTQGVDVTALRNRAETTLLAVRCHDGKNEDDAFAQSAKTLSNCPSGADGGMLGWLKVEDCAPEFAKEIFGQKEVGVLPRLVHSRFGLHVVEVLAREPGVEKAYESVSGAVSMALKQKTYVTALRQYISVLASEAAIEGVDLDEAASPLVQ